MDLKLAGKVVQVLEEQSGEGRSGPWRKQEFILETEGEYPKQVCIVQWGENIDRSAIQEGEVITAHIDIQSREYNGRWYTDVKAWKIERAQGSSPKAAAAPGPDLEWGATPAEPADDGDDDLPF